MKIILIRHGQTEDNKRGKIQSLNDSALSEEGLHQLNKVKKYIEKENIQFAYCSTLGRTIASAKIILEPHHKEPQPDKLLNELDWGLWSRLSKNELLSRWQKFYAKELLIKSKEEIRPPQGENSYDHLLRINHFFTESIFTLPESSTVLIVAHSGTNKVIIGFLRGSDPNDFYTIQQENCCINLLELADKKLVKERINIVEHLR